MRLRSTLPIAVLAAVALSLSFAMAASANYRVGLSEQSPKLFDSTTWHSLKLKRVRYIVPWDWYKHRHQRDEVNFYLFRAHQLRQDVLLTFTARSGCYKRGHYSRKKVCRAPSKKAYNRAVKRFIKQFPWIRTYAPWNEANHVSQPTAKHPKKAAQYYSILKRRAKHRTVMAADVLDQSNVVSYLRRFRHYSHGKGRIWGLHNYADVNRHRSRGLRHVLRTVPGQVWLTETGGIVTFLPNFKTSTKRAARATKYMFSLANKYDRRLRGNRSKVTRLYVYRWFGEKKGARFDAGLVKPNGKPRKSFKVFKKGIRGKRR